MSCVTKGGKNMVGHTGGQQRFPISSKPVKKSTHAQNVAASKAGMLLREQVQCEVREREAALRIQAPELYDEIMEHNKVALETNNNMTAEDKGLNGKIQYRTFEKELQIYLTLKK